MIDKRTVTRSFSVVTNPYHSPSLLTSSANVSA
jgi:hypothetical protein